MKTLLALIAVVAASFTLGATNARAGDSPSRGDRRVYSDCSRCQRPVYSYYRPVRYTNSATSFGWVPYYHAHLRGVSPHYIYHYGYSRSASRYSPYRSLADFNFFRTYPTSRGRFGYWYPF